MKTPKPRDPSPPSPDRAAPTPLERMRELTRRILAVPKAEVAR